MQSESLAQLLRRATAAIETPGDLTAAERAEVAEELDDLAHVMQEARSVWMSNASGELRIDLRGDYRHDSFKLRNWEGVRSASAEQERVWISFNGGKPHPYQFSTLCELNAFLTGITEAAEQNGAIDFEQFDTEEEAEKYRRELVD